MIRPSPLHVDDDAPMRQDTDSEDIRRIFPDLPASAHGRNMLLAQCDRIAYDTIRHAFPGFMPARIVAAMKDVGDVSDSRSLRRPA